jgi:transcriptional/translational regulatory protein YebC/TACO1
MSGHSKWSQIKRKKGKADQERGRLFGKLIRGITIAARDGGGDRTEPRLRAGETAGANRRRRSTSSAR